MADAVLTAVFLMEEDESMSGGSYEYMYSQVENVYVGRMFDDELDEMMKDLVVVLHDLEWWKSDDISEEDYRRTVERFKLKWFGTCDFNLRQRILCSLDKIKQEIEGYEQESEK